MNEAITTSRVRLIDHLGRDCGEVPLVLAQQKARDAGLDLVEVSPHVKPPVCKIFDYGKFCYQNQKKKNEAKKNQKRVDVKEIKLRPVTDKHDLEIKLRAVKKFVSAGHRVKFTMRFRGREISHQELGAKLFEIIQNDLGETVKVETAPKLEGRQMMMLIAPRTATKS